MRKIISFLLFVSLFSVVSYGQSYAATTEEGNAPAEEEATQFKWDIYGKLIFDGFYTSTSVTQGDVDSGAEFSGYGRKDGFQYSLLDLSLIGVNLEYGKFTGVVELGTSLETLVRLFYGKYNFDNGGYILVGQDTNLAAYSFGQVSNVQNALIDYGATNDVRRPMIRYGIHGFNIAVISGFTAMNEGNDAALGTNNEEGILAGFVNSVNDSENIDYVPGADVRLFEYIPRIEASYDIESDLFNGSIFGGYAYYLLKSKNTAGDYKDYGVQSFNVGFGGQFDIGDAFFQMTAYYGMNMTLTSSLFNPLNPAIQANADDNNKISVGNVQSAGGAIGFGYKINDMFTPQVGAGFSSSFGGPINHFDDAWGAYVNVVMQFNKWIALTPEIAFTDDLYDGNGNRQGNIIYAGAQIEISF